MSADQLPPGVVAASDAAAVDLTHLVCCRSNTALCGLDLTGKADVPDTAVLTCSVCDMIDEAGSTCGAWLCRLRQWARQWFGRPQ